MATAAAHQLRSPCGSANLAGRAPTAGTTTSKPSRETFSVPFALRGEGSGPREAKFVWTFNLNDLDRRPSLLSICPVRERTNHHLSVEVKNMSCPLGTITQLGHTFEHI